MKKIVDRNILVVCGGFSSEREVSLKSGQAILEALQSRGYHNLALFDLKRDNAQEIIRIRPDMVFIALHGKGGEDGSIQGLLEFAGIPYTGSGICTSAVCMDKTVTKRILSSVGLPTAKFLVYDRSALNNLENTANEIIDSLKLPVVLKSPCEGSSIGVFIVKDEVELKKAIEDVYKYGDALLAEQYLEGVEVTLPIMGNDDLTALPIIEIVSERDFYDFTAKYTAGLCHHIIPACINGDEEKEVEKIGKQAYRLFNCRGYARVDFIIDKNKGPMIIEINTLPGMTSMSLFPDAARYVGISFDELVEKILIYGFEAKHDLD